MTYTYRCDGCRRDESRWHTMAECDTPQLCPGCGCAMRRLPSGVGLAGRCGDREADWDDCAPRGGWPPGFENAQVLDNVTIDSCGGGLHFLGNGPRVVRDLTITRTPSGITNYDGAPIDLDGYTYTP